ncbi:MAG: DJ-1 family glyoxalase III [Lachnospiraceae bacterium]|nr:DJ-1 family glyoxalase III [Lachnospiraceae bacterium]
MSKTVVFLADGFEEIEGLMVVDLLRRGGVEVTTASIMGRLQITGRSNIEVKADCLFEDIKSFADVDMLVLPGGMPGTAHLDAYEPLKKLITDFHEQGKKLAAICAAPMVFGNMGLLKEKKATIYPGMEENLVGAEAVAEEVAVDGNITTSRGLGTALVFSLRLIEQLEGMDVAEKVAKSVVFLHKWA